MTLPNVLVIGSMKSGSSSVCRFLELHPSVFMVERLDPEFFSDDAVWARGLGWYESLFAGSEQFRWRAEGSNSYTMIDRHPHTLDRIKATLGDVKLIYLVRDPVQRIMSAWIQRRVDSPDITDHDPNKAIWNDPDFFVDASLFWKHITLYQSRFGAENLWVGCMEDMQREPEKFFASLCTFLDIEAPQSEDALNLHLNKSESKKIPSATYSLIRSLPGFTWLRHLVPSGIRSNLRRNYFVRSKAERPQFSEATLARLHEIIRPDAEQTLAFLGKEPRFWSLRLG